MRTGFKIALAVVLATALSLFTAGFVESWFDSQYATAGSIASIGSFEGLDGFLFSLIFFSALLGSILTGSLKKGFYTALPIVIFDIMIGALNPQLWIDLILLAAGLGLAWVILKLKAHFTTS